jgi:hypothetical protein
MLGLSKQRRGERRKDVINYNLICCKMSINEGPRQKRLPKAIKRKPLPAEPSFP